MLASATSLVPHPRCLARLVNARHRGHLKFLLLQVPARTITRPCSPAPLLVADQLCCQLARITPLIPLTRWRSVCRTTTNTNGPAAAVHAASSDATRGDRELKPLTLAFLVLITSRFFLAGMSIAHMTLARVRQQATPSPAAKTLAIIVLVLSHLSIPWLPSSLPPSATAKPPIRQPPCKKPPHPR